MRSRLAAYTTPSTHGITQTVQSLIGEARGLIKSNDDDF
jgi:hypothetical protein